MATNFTINKTYTYENGTLKHTYQPGSISLPQATKGIHAQTVTFTTAESDVTFTTLGTPGRTILHNLESTTTGKTFNWGLKSSTGGIPQYFKLPAKNMAEVYYGTSAMVIRGKAASGSLMVHIITYEA